MKNIGILTGTRAEYGLLKPVMQKVEQDKDLNLCLIVTGMHLSEQFGYTYREIEKDGFRIDYKNDMELVSDTSYAICKSMGKELAGFADIFEEADLDMLVLLGDRFEIQMAAVAAMLYRIPVAHIHGGELTQGLMDDAIRHSVTKMSDLHFTSTSEYAQRVIQMGEQPERVFCVGALGIENIKSIRLLSREQLCQKFGDIFLHNYIMVTYHPVTLEKHTAGIQFQKLLNVVENHPEYHYISTYANADTDGAIINKMIESYTQEHKNTKAFVSMGQLGYLSALQHCSAVLGNSSSGIIEAPSFHIPTINIGDRQKGRVRAKTVIDCGYETRDIEQALTESQNQKFKDLCQESTNPYEGKNTSEQIIMQIKKYLNQVQGKQKIFYDIEV